MSVMIDLEQLRYPVPDGLVELADREEEGKILVLYGGHIALLDVIQKPTDKSSPEHLLRIETSPDKALDLLYHPSLYASPEDAKRIFDPKN